MKLVKKMIEKQCFQECVVSLYLTKSQYLLTISGDFTLQKT